jgi:serine/threonine-protein kinase HipA
MKRCLYCYQTLTATETDFHAACSRKIFGTSEPPQVPYNTSEIEQLGVLLVQSQMAVTGVQPKLSLGLPNGSNLNKPKRFTLVDIMGGYILKPATPHYLHLPEVEDVTMHIASDAGIGVVPHSLIRMQSGDLAYITKRVDRYKKTKIHMEDMCQLSERMTEEKYNGSYEQIGKLLKAYSTQPGLDIVNFSEQVVFSFLTGNADMHLKNFSLIQSDRGSILAPAYDMVATKLVNPVDDEDLALTLNGKKKKLKLSDFTLAFQTLELTEKQQENIFSKMEKTYPKWKQTIKDSFLPAELKKEYLNLIQKRFLRLNISV